MPAPETVPEITVCITTAVIEPDEPAPPTVSVTFANEPVISGPPLLVQSTPTIEPEPVRLNDTDAAVMPSERFGSNGEGTTVTTGADG